MSQPKAKPILAIRGLSKTYASGHLALAAVDLDIFEGEIFALLGPNGAGKTTLINIITGLVNASRGSVSVGGFDHVREYKKARALVGLVPQELQTDMFAKVKDVVAFSRGVFGLKPNPALLEEILRSLSLWEKKDNRILTLSGGMKRRVLIAKALAHEPRILFLDEPTAGVDVKLRREMWALVSQMRSRGVTVILTTHYIEEAEAMADRIGVIDRGKLVLTEEKTALMQKLGKKELTLTLARPAGSLPAPLVSPDISVSADRSRITYRYNSQAGDTHILDFLDQIKESGLAFTDLETKESSLEDIFVSLVNNS